MKFTLSVLAASLLTALASCNNNEAPKQATAPAVAQPKLPQPFRFHKAIEVKPGLTFDVLSWGRGAKYVGAYMILRSDSAKAVYKSTTDELDGEIKDVWNMDIDSDGNPEIFIQVQGGDKDADQYLTMHIYEFTEGGSQQKLRFPDLTSATKKSYRGKDSVYVKDGDLFREFPLYEEADTAGVNPTGKKMLQYILRGNNFSVKEIKQDK